MRKHQQRSAEIRCGIEVFEADFVYITWKKCKWITSLREPNDGAKRIGPYPAPVAVSASRTFTCQILARGKNRDLYRTLIVGTRLITRQERLEIESLLPVKLIELIDEIIPNFGPLHGISIEANLADLDNLRCQQRNQPTQVILICMRYENHVNPTNPFFTKINFQGVSRACINDNDPVQILQYGAVAMPNIQN
jgi:hypothetical protein